MAQLDCGQCGYFCETYAAAIASGAEASLSRCVPGGKATSRKLKELFAEIGAPAGGESDDSGRGRGAWPDAGNRSGRADRRSVASGSVAACGRDREGYAARRARGGRWRFALSGRRQPRRRRAQLPRSGRARSSSGSAASPETAVQSPDGIERPLFEALSDCCEIRRPSDQAIEVLASRAHRPRGVAHPSGDGRGLSRSRSGQCRFARPARGIPIGAAAAFRTDFGARPAVAAALFDRLVAKDDARRSASRRRRGALSDARAPARRRRLDLSQRPAVAGRNGLGATSIRPTGFACRRPIGR